MVLYTDFRYSHTEFAVEDAESDGEVIKPRYDDIEVEELDWNYTMDGFYDNEEEEQVDQKEAEGEMCLLWSVHILDGFN